VRIGMPQSVHGLTDIVKNPIYSTGVGLLHYGLKRQLSGVVRGGARQRKPQREINVGGFFERAKQWVQNNF